MKNERLYMRASQEFNKALAVAVKKTGLDKTRIIEDIVKKGLPSYVKQNPKRVAL